MDIDWDIIAGINDVSALVKFLEKYHSNINFHYKNNEYGNNTFQKSFINIKRMEKEVNCTETPNYEGGYSTSFSKEVIKKIISKDLKIFNDSFKTILEFDKPLFFELYEEYKDSLDIEIKDDRFNFTLEEFERADKHGLIKNYHEFILPESDNLILEKMLKENKIDLYSTIKKQKYHSEEPQLYTFGSEYIDHILDNIYRIFSDNFYHEDKLSELRSSEYQLAKINIIKNHIDGNKDFFISSDSFLDMIKNTVDYKFNINQFKNLVHIFTSQKNIKDFDINILFKDDFLKIFNFKNLNNCQKHFHLIFSILEKQNNLDYIFEKTGEFNKIYKNDYPEIAFMAIKDNNIFSYNNLIREPLLSVIEKQYLFKDTAYKYISCFADDIKNDKEVLSKIKNNFSLDNDHYNNNGFMTCSDFSRLSLIFDQDNFINILKYSHENNRRFDNMLNFLKGCSVADISLIENNSPRFYKTNFINKSAYINKHALLKSEMESIIIRGSLQNQEVDIQNKPKKRL